MARDIARKGYLIRTNPITGGVWIEKGGAFIATAPDVLAAAGTIDDLVNPPISGRGFCDTCHQATELVDTTDDVNICPACLRGEPALIDPRRI